jgi:putative Mg2+ transporter-C (MgtC) family protein
VADLPVLEMALAAHRTTEWRLLGPLLLALILSSLVGLERELRAKSAGLRTHTLVGVGSALFVLVSAYGFRGALDGVPFDPSRVAAQVVTGIGFLGAGLIFVRQDRVKGLTTAATIWLTAAIGMAAAAGLPVLATTATAIHYVVVFGFPPLMHQLRLRTRGPEVVRITYLDGHGVLRRALTVCTELGWSVERVLVEREGAAAAVDGTAVVALTVAGRATLPALVERLTTVEGVLHVETGPRVEDEID